MATSNIGGEPRERYTVEDVKAKVQVDRISKELKVLEVDDKDFYVCVNRDVKSKFIKADESKDSKEDKIDQFVVKHHETITVVQGLGNTKLTNPDEWIIRINRELLETTFFKGKEIIDKVSQRRENLERNKKSPIIQAAIAKELRKRSNEEQKIESDPDQKEVNNNFAPETTPEWSPDTTEDEPENLERNKKSPTIQAPIAKELLKRSNEEQKIEQGEENNNFAPETTPEWSPDSTKDEPETQRKIESETTERENVIKLEPEIKTASEKISLNGESYSIIETQRKFESETTERENVVKLEPEIKTEEDIKIKLEPNDEKDSQNELRELISEKEAVDPAPVINNEKAAAEAGKQPEPEAVEEPIEKAIKEAAPTPKRTSRSAKAAPEPEVKEAEVAPNSNQSEKPKIESELNLEAAAEAGKRRVREVFHMDVAELIIERDA